MTRATSLGRPIERLADLGVSALGIEELLALVLQDSGTQSSLHVARELIREHRSVAALARATHEELVRTPGVDDSSAAAIVAAFQLARLAASEPRPEALRSAADVAAVAMAELSDARRERVIVLVCDAGNRLRRIVTVSEGTIDRALFPVREILNGVLRHDGRAFAVAHSHPSGDPHPSAEDAAATQELEAAARIVGLRFLDHVVVGGSEWRSVRGDRQRRD